jgi:LysM repeat protein
MYGYQGYYRVDRRRMLISTLVFLWFLLDSSVIQAQADPVNEIIQRVNALRAAYGVPAYKVDYALMVAAQTQASWGLENKHFGHDGPGGSMPDDRAKAAGYGNGESSFAIENVAAGTASLNTPELVVTMWQGDWGHLNAMISADYEHIGVGFAEANGFSYYVMMVGWVGTKASSGDTQGQEIPVVDPSSGPFVVSELDEFGAIYHEVQSGQTAWTIAAKYGIELAELFELNNLTEDSILHPGDVLMIRPPDPPKSTPASTPTRTPTSTPASLRSTDIPNKTPTSEQATEISIESDTLSDQNREDVSNDLARSNVNSVLLVVSVGLALLVSVILVIRLREQ